MKPVKFIRLMGLLMRLGKKRIPSSSLEKIQRFNEITPSGLSFDTYRHVKKNGLIWIAAHGISVNGKNDSRLVHFAQSLACSGMICIVPMLNGLASCRWEPSDLDRLDEMVRLISERYGQGVGLIGFSFGASYCLLSAARVENSNYLRHVIAFGAYYNCETIFEEFKKDSSTASLTDREWDEGIYRRMAIINGYGKTTLAPQARREMDSLLKRYCTEASLEEKKRFYREYLRHIDISRMVNAAFNPHLFNALSPAGKLSLLNCPVTLIHDRHDPVVPPAHAERIYGELQEKPGHNHRLALTSILSHVSFPGILQIPDLVRFVKAMADVF